MEDIRALAIQQVEWARAQDRANNYGDGDEEEGEEGEGEGGNAGNGQSAPAPKAESNVTIIEEPAENGSSRIIVEDVDD